jgi:hypothetical protein
MNCRQVDERLSESLDEPLPHDVQVAVEEHLAGCTDCVVRLRGYVTTVETLREVAVLEEEAPVPPMPEPLVQRILAARDLEAARRDGNRRTG